MPTIKELKAAIEKLSLGDRETLAKAIEQSIESEYDRMAEVGVAADIRTVERILAKHLVTGGQMVELQEPLGTTDHGEAQSVSWDRVRQEILAELRYDERPHFPRMN